jgi:hypothetical protein
MMLQALQLARELLDELRKLRAELELHRKGGS